MKVNVEVDATPEELRRFMGWPDVQPLHEEMLKTVSERMQAGTDGYDPLTLLQPCMPAHFQNMESLQRAFWEAFGGRQGGDESDADSGGRK